MRCMTSNGAPAPDAAGGGGVRGVGAAALRVPSLGGGAELALHVLAAGFYVTLWALVAALVGLAAWFAADAHAGSTWLPRWIPGWALAFWCAFTALFLVLAQFGLRAARPARRRRAALGARLGRRRAAQARARHGGGPRPASGPLLGHRPAGAGHRAAAPARPRRGRAHPACLHGSGARGAAPQPERGFSLLERVVPGLHRAHLRARAGARPAAPPGARDGAVRAVRGPGDVPPVPGGARAVRGPARAWPGPRHRLQLEPGPGRGAARPRARGARRLRPDLRRGGHGETGTRDLPARPRDALPARRLGLAAVLVSHPAVRRDSDPVVPADVPRVESLPELHRYVLERIA